MDMTSLLQTFAIAKDGSVVSVNEVERGQACECICPACKSPLISRQGDVRVWHFAHASGSECDGGAESALHLAAKAAIVKASGLMLPEVSVQQNPSHTDGHNTVVHASIPATWIDFSRVNTEVNLGTIIPDVVGTAGSACYLIEVGVSHFVDERKRTAIENLGHPSIEIDLSGFEREAWSWTDLDEVVVQGTSSKRWLYNPGQDILLAKARSLAIDTASATLQPNIGFDTQKVKPPRTRYWPDGRIVDLTEFPFGLRLWSPYDSNFNEVIKAWGRALGGRWQPAHKNWLFPLEAKAYLVEEISRRQTRPPVIQS